MSSIRSSIKEFAVNNGIILDWNCHIKVGDWYVACRNSGPKLLKAKEIKDSYVIPEEVGQYCFDIWECVKVVRMI